METETTAAKEVARAEARLPGWMAACGAIAVVAMLIRAQFGFALGLALGAALAILNYYWLHESVSALMSSSVTRIPNGLILKLLIRYPLAFGAVYLFYATGWLPFAAVLLGLFVPIAGAMIEAIFQVVESLRSPADLPSMIKD